VGSVKRVSRRVVIERGHGKRIGIVTGLAAHIRELLRVGVLGVVAGTAVLAVYSELLLPVASSCTIVTSDTGDGEVRAREFIL
jgi:hypothetical protein